MIRKNSAKCGFAINWRNKLNICSNYFSFKKRQNIAYFDFRSEFDINILTIKTYLKVFKLQHIFKK